MSRVKIFALIIVASMILASCATPTATVAPTAIPATDVPAVKAGLPCAPNCAYKDLVIGFLQTGSEGGWRAANTASFKETADQLGLTLKFYEFHKTTWPSKWLVSSSSSRILQ